MSELELVRAIRRRAGGRARGVVRGIGDDCAILRFAGERKDLLLGTDLLIEGVHCRRSTHPAEAVGWKALARGLSDIAAMGGVPRWSLVSLGLPGWADKRWVKGFYAGLLRHRVPLVGGDLSRSREFTADIVVVGEVAKGQALRRDGARPGDGIYVSGVLGGSALGLRTRRGGAWQRHLYPEPRLGLGRHLVGRATSCIDLSDGLSLDLHRLCLESKVAAVIDRPLPVFPGVTLDQALHGGEDYELLFTSRSAPARWRHLPLTRIGTVEPGKSGEVTFFGRRLRPMGYDHFRSR